MTDYTSDKKETVVKPVSKDTQIQIREDSAKAYAKDRMNGQVELTKFQYIIQSAQNWWGGPPPVGGAMMLGPDPFSMCILGP